MLLNLKYMINNFECMDHKYLFDNSKNMKVGDCNSVGISLKLYLEENLEGIGYTDQLMYKQSKDKGMEYINKEKDYSKKDICMFHFHMNFYIDYFKF
jgi:hypothetical protein